MVLSRRRVWEKYLLHRAAAVLGKDIVMGLTIRRS